MNTVYFTITSSSLNDKKVFTKNSKFSYLNRICKNSALFDVLNYIASEVNRFDFVCLFEVE